MAILDRIKFDGLTSREWLIYRYPTEKIVLGSTLIVGEGQVAVFVYQGKIADVFPAGAYVLSTGNLPILGSLVNLVYGGKTPFSAEIYYVNLTTKLDMCWGTTDSIQVIDPKYFVRLHIRAFGQFALKITNIPLFIREVTGSLGNNAVKYNDVLDFFKGILNTKIKTIIADVIINQKISAFEITPKLEEISKIAFDKLAPSFNEFGLDILNFYIQSINFPDEDFAQINKILEDKAAFEIMGDNRYSTKRSFDVYESAANNANGVAGAFAAGGIGLGLGANLVQNQTTTVQPVVEESTYCPKCNARNKPNASFCSSCGASLKTKSVKCFNCGKELEADAKFCSYCGAYMAKKVCECGNEIEPDEKFCSNCGKMQEV